MLANDDGHDRVDAHRAEDGAGNVGHPEHGGYVRIAAPAAAPDTPAAAVARQLDDGLADLAPRLGGAAGDALGRPGLAPLVAPDLAAVFGGPAGLTRELGSVPSSQPDKLP